MKIRPIDDWWQENEGDADTEYDEPMYWISSEGGVLLAPISISELSDLRDQINFILTQTSQ